MATSKSFVRSLFTIFIFFVRHARCEWTHWTCEHAERRGGGGKMPFILFCKSQHVTRYEWYWYGCDMAMGNSCSFRYNFPCPIVCVCVDRVTRTPLTPRIHISISLIYFVDGAEREWLVFWIDLWIQPIACKLIDRLTRRVWDSNELNRSCSSSSSLSVERSSRANRKKTRISWKKLKINNIEFSSWAARSSVNSQKYVLERNMCK